VYDDSETKSFRTNNGETSSKNFRNTRLSSFTTENSPCYVADKEKYKNIYNKQTSTDSSVIQLTNVKFRETLADSNLLTVNGSEIVPVTSISLNNHSTRKSQMRISTTEARITKTLAVIIFLFVLCWCPFFTAYIIRSQDETQISPVLMDVFIWLGYFNSALNPILYAILNNNFRTAFKDILSCACCIKRRSN
jgi:hypothetical protein